jgi:membrane associated rhomboid family serine protease
MKPSSQILITIVVRLKRKFIIIPTEMEGKGTRRSTPTVTYFILAFTVLLQLYLSMLPESEILGLYEDFSLIPVRFFNGVNLHGIITYMFLHGDMVHIFINSIGLYGAGSIVERDIGHIRYLMVFLLSGVMAGVAHCFLNPISEAHLVGSSGAIFGVIAVLFLLMPFKITFALVVPLPSVIVGLMLSAVELSAFLMSTDLAIAHDAHLSGFIMGGICAFVLDKKRAMRGLFIAIVVLVVIYLLGIYLKIIPM